MLDIAFKLHNSWRPFQINDSEIKDTESWSKVYQRWSWSLLVALITDTELPELPTATPLETSFPSAWLTSHSSSSSRFYSPTNWWIHVRSSRQWHSYCQARLPMSYKRWFVTPSNYSWQWGLFSRSQLRSLWGEWGSISISNARLLLTFLVSVHFPRETGLSLSLKMLWSTGKNSRGGKHQTKIKKKK